MTHLIRQVVVAGVSGAGKTTLGQRLAQALGWSFAEGDELHPAANIEKMRSGVPLTDEDRGPWLDAIGRRLDQTPPDAGLVITCSALRRAYRDRLRSGRKGLIFCLAEAPKELLEERLHTRTGHYMPTSLLDSQFATLEPLEPDERGIRVDASQTPEEMLRSTLARMEQGW